MLSPYLGTSHFVWTAQIGITLLSLAAGYYLGGRIADRHPSAPWMYIGILAAAVYLVLTVPLTKPVASSAIMKFPLAVASILSSLFLFFVPLTLLAAVGPFIIRLLTLSISVVGGQVGRLNAISTLGSVAGTVLISYLLIPFLPNSRNMCLTSALLVAVSAGYFLIWGNRKNKTSVAAILVAALIVGLANVRVWTFPPVLGLQHVEELHRENSNFGLLQVLKSKVDGRLFFLNDFLTQNTYHPDSKQSVSLFTYMLHDLATGYTESIENVLCIGMGVGIVPMQFAREGKDVDVVEINPDIVPIAEQYFDFEASLVDLKIGDGRFYLHALRGQYDAVILDAFLGDSSPSHLMTREAFSAMAERLRPDGVLVINSFGDFRPGHDFATASLYRTLKAVFDSVIIHASGNGNVFFVASKSKLLPEPQRAPLSTVYPALRSEYLGAWNGVQTMEQGRGIVLTDDYNPVEFFDAQNREELRRQLAVGMTRPNR